jgi:hypothetical protein
MYLCYDCWQAYLKKKIRLENRMSKKMKTGEETTAASTAAALKKRKAGNSVEESEDDEENEEEESEEMSEEGTEDGDVGRDVEADEADDADEDKEGQCPDCSATTFVRTDDMGNYKKGNTETVSEFPWKLGYRQVLSNRTREKGNNKKKSTKENNASCDGTPVQTKKTKQGQSKGDEREAEASMGDDMRGPL